MENEYIIYSHTLTEKERHIILKTKCWANYINHAGYHGLSSSISLSIRNVTKFNYLTTLQLRLACRHLP